MASNLPYSLPDNIQLPLKHLLQCIVSLPGLGDYILNGVPSTHEKRLLQIEFKKIYNWMLHGTGDLVLNQFPTFDEVDGERLAGIITQILDCLNVSWHCDVTKYPDCSLCGITSSTGKISVLNMADYIPVSLAIKGFLNHYVVNCPKCSNFTTSIISINGVLPCILVLAFPFGVQKQISIDDFDVSDHCESKLPGVGLYKHVATIAADAGGHWSQCLNFSNSWSKSWIFYRGSQVVPGYELTTISYENYCFLIYIHSGFYSSISTVVVQ